MNDELLKILSEQKNLFTELIDEKCNRDMKTFFDLFRESTTACDKCKNPKDIKHGLILCPVCDRDDKINQIIND